ncbi:MAG: AAA family ATPase [Clostridia bacterium]|nr:AAA family ATPase [Clostridia bacterium]
MFIALNGQLASGKSTICRILEKRYGFSTFSTGQIQRGLANEMGITTLELNELGMKDYHYDYIIDGRLSQYAKENTDKDIIFDSRMAWHFVEGAYRIHLLVSPIIAAERVYGKRETREETYHSVQEAMEDLIKRRQVEAERYKVIYHANMMDFRNYDLIIDTSTLAPEGICDIIYDNIKDLLESHKQISSSGNHSPRIYLSPKNIYPSGQAEPCGPEPSLVQVLKVEDSMYIYRGAEIIKAANMKQVQLPFVEVVMAAQDDELIPGTSVSAKDFVKTTKADIAAWENDNGFKYGYIPDRIH